MLNDALGKFRKLEMLNDPFFYEAKLVKMYLKRNPLNCHQKIKLNLKELTCYISFVASN